jgi:hypothetical protein
VQHEREHRPRFDRRQHTRHGLRCWHTPCADWDSAPAARLIAVLILPPAEQRRAGPRRLSARERWLLSGVGVAVLALVVAVAISLASRAPASSHGCLRATYAGPVGAEQISRCGAAARELCASLGAAGGFTGDAARTIAGECRKLRLPVGR